MHDATMGRGLEAPRNRVRPTVVYAAGFAAALGLDVVARLPISPAAAGPESRWGLGTVLVAAGTALFVWALALFRRIRTGIMPDAPARRVVTVGPYRWSRNPMFVAFTAIYLGLAWLANTVWPLILLPVVVLVVTRTVIACEERYMRRRFGEAYDRYCARVARWL